MRTLIAGAVVAAAMIAGSAAQAAPIAGSVAPGIMPATAQAVQSGDVTAGVELVGDRHWRRHGRGHWRDRYDRYGYYAPPPRYYYAPPPPVYYAPPPPPPRYYYPSRPGGYFSFGFGGPL